MGNDKTHMAEHFAPFVLVRTLLQTFVTNETFPPTFSTLKDIHFSVI